STDDLDATVDAAVAGRLDNTGQSCNAAKRFIVAADLYDDFLAKFTGKLLAAGDGIAPLSSERAAIGLEQQVNQAVEAGASLAIEGRRDGAFFPPAVLTNVTEDNPAFRQELFGPVATVYRVEGEGEALALANDTPFGLGSYVFTTDPEQAAR
ncbi:aldehyde dehydrogenase family protein, partial [Mycobacterium kansasii]